jgi:hypothetical protein
MLLTLLLHFHSVVTTSSVLQSYSVKTNRMGQTRTVWSSAWDDSWASTQPWECWVDPSRLSWFFESWLLFYIERIVSLMETIVFNSIQVINYWFTLHCALRLLYQQAQTFSPNIWGISDQDVTLWTLLQYKNDNQCAEVSFDKSSQPSRPSANNQCTQGTSTQCVHRWEREAVSLLIKLELYIEFNQAKFKMNKGLFTVSYLKNAAFDWVDLKLHEFSTRHQRNEWTIRNSYSATIRSSRMSFKEPSR